MLLLNSRHAMAGGEDEAKQVDGLSKRRHAAAMP
jgi:hypothetical protein